jgi:hypothetical protein
MTYSRDWLNRGAVRGGPARGTRIAYKESRPLVSEHVRHHKLMPQRLDGSAGSGVHMMKMEELDRIRSRDKRCGDMEQTMAPEMLDRRRLLEYVDELRAEVDALRGAISLDV